MRETHGSNTTGDYFGAAIVSQQNKQLASSTLCSLLIIITLLCGDTHCPFPTLFSSSLPIGQFLRLSCDTPPQIVYSLMTAHWGVSSPNLVVSVVGGGGCEKVKTWVREVLRQGLVKAAHRTARYYVQNTSRDSCCLDNNYQAFLLVDDGSVGRRGGETAFRSKMEDYISHQRAGIWGSGSIEIPVLCMLISGEAAMLKRVDLSLKKATPWLVLNGSGPAADLICELLDALSDVPMSCTSPPPEGEGSKSPSVELRERTRERVRRHFPAEADREKLVDRALVRASKRVSSDASEYTEELKLAVAWNRVDIAKSELFNGDIQWRYEDLEDSMTDALINNKPQFVRLFNENGLNILDYLNYQRLEGLYRSLSNSSLAYTLLQRHLTERQSLARSLPTVPCSPDEPTPLKSPQSPMSPISGPSSAKELSLYEVSRLLWDILGDVCQPFYYSPLGLDKSTSTWRTLKQVNKLLLGDCPYREQLYVFSECYQSSESRSFTLLIRQSPSLLSQIWWGDMERSTEVWKLILTFFLPPLIYTNLISFRPFVLLRWREFWFAPVTAFLGNVLMYFLFLCLFAYVLLLDFKPPPPHGPSTLEFILYFWVFTLVCEEFR
ncbi:unnamed protein product, partial [Coregonus sp. 'balchen']